MIDENKNERGATAMLVAGSLTLLIGMAAIAVDLSAGWNERRQDQTAADLGATAAAVYSVSEAIGIDAALTTIQANLDTTYTASEWQTLWTGCTDPDRPAGFVPVDNPWSSVATDKLDCMSIDIANKSGNPEFRVRVPNQIVDAQFGRVIGTNSIETSASAHSSYLMTGGGDILPFGITNAAPYGTNCVLQPASGLAAPPCDGGSLGNFGFLLVPNWGNDDKGTTADCTSLSDLISQHVAVGLDHLVLWAAGPDGTPATFPGTGGSSPSSLSATQELYAKKDDCSLATGTAVANDSTPTWPLNTLQTATGVGSSFNVKDGLIGAPVSPAITFLGQPPRLQQTVNSRTVTVREKSGGDTYDYVLDNTPLWRYLVEPSQISETSITGPCNRNSIEAVDAPKAAYGDTSPNGWELARNRMANCLSAYNTYLSTNPANPEAIFDKSIMENPRFAWSPRFHFTDFGSGTSWQPIHSFESTYIDGVWFNCNGSASAPINSASSCSGSSPKGIQFYPGEYVDGVGIPGSPPYGNLRLDQVTAYVIPIEAMPDEVKDTYPGDLDGPFRVQLVR